MSNIAWIPLVLLIVLVVVYFKDPKRKKMHEHCKKLRESMHSEAKNKAT